MLLRIIACEAEPVEDCRVILRRYGECLLSEETALFECRGGTVAVEYALQKSELFHGSHDDCVGEVFGGGADKGYAAYVDFLDDVLLRSTGGYGILKGIQVYNHEVDSGYFVLGELGAVTLVVAACEDAAEHLGMECLYAASENRGIACEVFNGLAGYAETLDV